MVQATCTAMSATSVATRNQTSVLAESNLLKALSAAELKLGVTM